MRKMGLLLLGTGASWALGVGFGLEGTAGFSSRSVSYTVLGSTFDFSESGPVFGGRLAVDLWVSDNLGVELGAGKLLYSWKDSDSETTTKTGALSIPLFVKYGLPSILIKPYFGLGLDVLKWDKKYTTVDSSGNETEGEDSDPDTDFGLLLGAGVNVPAGPVVLVPGLYFMYNLTPKDADANYDDYSATHYDVRFNLKLLYTPPLVGE